MKPHLTIASAVATVSVAVASVVVPMMIVDDFPDYEPPSRLDIITYDYYDGRPGSGYGQPADGSRDTDVPTWQLDYPYRAFFFGAYSGSSGAQGHDAQMYILFSKLPVLDYFYFFYNDTKGNHAGYISCDMDYAYSRYSDDEIRLMSYPGGTGVSPSQQTVALYSLASWNTTGRYFYFDFWYECCSNLDFNIPPAEGYENNGLWTLYDVPYGYILTCEDHDTTGGGGSSQKPDPDNPGGGGSSSGGGGGSSSGGGGGGSSSSGGGGDGSDGDDGWTYPGVDPDEPYPWEDDSNIPDIDFDISVPDYDYGGAEDAEGENGDTWELPGWGDSLDPPFDDDYNIPDLPIDLEQSTPDFPIDLEQSMPDLPASVQDMEESYPDPVLPSGNWPPAFPG